MLRLTLTFVFVFLTIFCLSSQSGQVSTDSLTQELIITHSKVPVTMKSAFKPTIVISQAEISRQVNDDISELLDQQTGIQVNSAYSNPGKDKSVFLQGASGEFTVILIDGVPLTDPSGIGGTFDLRSISLSKVERIEIVKGGQSVLYGSDAIAGVINIITKSTNSSKSDFGIKGTLGSLKSRDISSSLQVPLGSNLGLSIDGSYASSDGISEALDEGNSGFEKDGFKRTGLQTSVRWKASDNFSFSPFLRLSQFDGDYDDGAFTDAQNTYETKWLQSGFSTQYTQERLTLNGSFTHNKTDRSFNSAFGTFDFKGRFNNMDLYGQFFLGDALSLILGLNYQSLSMIDANSTVVDPDATLISPYATVLYSPTIKTRFEVGARYNDHSAYGSNANFSIGGSHWIKDNVKMYAYYGTSFKAPNLFQLYGQFGANPDLKPQNGRSLNIGLSFNAFGLFDEVSLGAFDRRVDNLIIFDFSTGYSNIPSQHDQGIELSLSKGSDKFSLKAAYSYLFGELNDQSGVNDPVENLIRRPKHQIDGSLSYTYLQQNVIRLSLRYSGSREDAYFDNATFLVEEVTLDPYWLGNFYINYKLNNANLTLFGKVRNLFDTDFQEVAGFSTIGRNFHLGFSWSL